MMGLSIQYLIPYSYIKKKVTVREKNIHLSIDHKFKKHSSHLNIL